MYGAGWVGEEIREGENRYSQEEKRGWTGHPEPSNPSPRGHGRSIRRRKQGTSQQKRTRRLADEPGNYEKPMSHMQQEEMKLPLPNSPHPYPTLLGIPIHVEASRNPIQRNRLKVIHGRAPIRLLDIRYNLWLDSSAQRRYVIDRMTEMACFLRKNRDVSIENSLRLVECTLAPLLK